MAKATAIKLGELNICLPGSVYVQKKCFRRGRVVPDFPVDGHIAIYVCVCVRVTVYGKIGHNVAYVNVGEKSVEKNLYYYTLMSY